jgi:hypothetical protein
MGYSPGMPDQILFDKVIYMDRLKRAGIAEDQARAFVDAAHEALREGVATKVDLHDLKAELSDLRASIKVMDSKIYAVLAVVVLSAIKLFWPY